MSFLTVDIETVPQARFIDPERYAAAEFSLEEDWYAEHHTDSDDVCMAIEDGQAPLAATKCVPALHATTCHIVQVSFGWRSAEGSLQRVVSQSDGFGPTVAEAEPQLLLDALRMIAGACDKRTTIVSFNGKQFDVPVLRARGALLRLQAPRIPWGRLLYPWDHNEHADLRIVLGNDRRANGTLKWWCDAFGIESRECGGEVGQWVRDGEWGKLREYGEVEAQTLVELYEAVRHVL